MVQFLLLPSLPLPQAAPRTKSVLVAWGWGILLVDFSCRIEFFTSSINEVLLQVKDCKPEFKLFTASCYYIDTSVLLENRPLVKFIQNYIRDPSGVFSIYDDVISRFCMTFCAKLPNSGWVELRAARVRYKVCAFVFCLYNKKKITRWVEDMNFIFSC